MLAVPQQSTRSVLDQLPADVRKELSDPEFGTRKHHSRATYALGCHGPLCRKKERDRGRARNESKALVNGKEYKPNHEIRVEEDELLEKIITWYEGLCS
jgi:hypothetical protein